MKDFSKDNFILEAAILSAFSLDALLFKIRIEDNLLIVFNESEEISFSFNEKSLQEELEQIKYFEPYGIIGDDFLNIVLLDPFHHLNFLTEKDEIKLKGPLKGRVSKNFYNGLLFTSLKHLISPISWEQLKAKSTPIDFLELIKENLYVLELTNLSDDQIRSANFINRTINSVLSHLSFKENIYLEIAKNYYYHQSPTISTITNIEYLISDNNEPLMYFLSGEKISYPHLKYLEYYHVIEYFFLQSSINRIETIVSELFALKLIKSSNDDLKDSYWKKIIEMFNLYGKKDKINEDEQIKTVINDFLGYKKFKMIIENDEIDIKKITDTIFDDKQTKIDITKVYDAQTKRLKADVDPMEEISFCNQLANRIYKIRNHIVHTKRGEKDSLFIPNKESFELLRYDLMVIRLISFRLIIDMSN